MPGNRRLVAILLVLLLGGPLWHASRFSPTGPAEGVALEGEVTREEMGTATTLGRNAAGASQAGPKPASMAPRTLRIGTFNIHGGKGADGCRDLDRVAQSLRGLDFAALNEVHGPRLWQSLDQAGQLGQSLGLAWLFAPNTRTWYHLDSGNGLLSALPVAFWQRIPLAHRSDRGYRNAVLAGLRHGDRTVHVLLTHITRHPDRSRQEQLRAVGDLYLALAEPAILLGDLNSDANDPEIRRLLASPGVSDVVGRVLGPKAPPRIDWILVRGLRCVHAGILDHGASDHPMVWAELE